ncbi:glycoside hydrolase family 3 N-terminal domain-containing protein [Pseudenhygromyxa sp. WMMC2535]|uniref:glycoside hydrolase family 3 N-terminal domain-containing protein n=1 Tax=Pseudenhygromyxa sp. WMMC2535 TaxID=2712867 RepID=UPI0023DE05EC|nr:glycoside hydrolase family 3 N-terminal domain-containing protein [Pseudenhygromyxa sp. WMMC2535]
MSAQWHPGQLLFVGFPGRTIPPDLAACIREGRVGGVILFKRNVGEPSEVRELVRELHALAPADAPLTVAVDQEGGRVQRLRDPWTEWPPMRALGSRSVADTARFAAAMALELLDCGFDLDFAPVVDVDSNPDNPVIGDRSFARDAARVSAHATAFIQAMQGKGLAACAKHFPGHGDTDLDSHLALPRLDHGRERLDRVELPPFRAAVEAGVASVMTAHVLYPRLDPKRPATLSPEVMGCCATSSATTAWCSPTTSRCGPSRITSPSRRAASGAARRRRRDLGLLRGGPARRGDRQARGGPGRAGRGRAASRGRVQGPLSGSGGRAPERARAALCEPPGPGRVPAGAGERGPGD